MENLESNELIVNIGLDSLRLNNRGVITGEIYLSLKDFIFPEKGWDDFVIVILSWWLTAISNVIEGSIGCVQEFSFMEGPLLVKITKISDDCLEMRFVKEQKDSELVFFTCQSSIDQVKHSLLKSTGELLEEIKLRNWGSEESKKLEEMFKIL